MADLIALAVAHDLIVGWTVIGVLFAALVAVAVRTRPQSCEDTDTCWPLDILIDAMVRPDGASDGR